MSAGLFVLAVIFASDVEAGCPRGWICPRTSLHQARIGAWYTPWWQSPGSPGDEHWRTESRYRPELDYYDSGDGIITHRHVGQMKEAGIDFLIIDDTNGVDNDYGNTAAFFRTLNSSDRLRKTLGFRAALAAGGGLWAQHSVQLFDQEVQRVWDRYARTPAYYQWLGRPLLVVYNDFGNPDGYALNWNDHGRQRFTLRPAAGMVDAGNRLQRPYGVHGYWGWVHRYPQWTSSETMGVTPGWSRAHLGDPRPPIDREGGLLYQRSWLHAIAHRPKAIVISSWNDFAEETAIEPARPKPGFARAAWRDAYGEEVPDWYVQITAAYANLRTGLETGTYYCDDSPAGCHVYAVAGGRLAYQNATPRRRPVIRLPAGTLEDILANGDQAQFVRQEVPPRMAPGGAYSVSITMRNTGLMAWTRVAEIKLGSHDPRDNTRWGRHRVEVAETIHPGEEWTARFQVVAPQAPGSYNFRWQMLQERVKWFGNMTPLTTVMVETPSGAPAPVPPSASSSVSGVGSAVAPTGIAPAGVSPARVAPKRRLRSSGGEPTPVAPSGVSPTYVNP